MAPDLAEILDKDHVQETLTLNTLVKISPFCINFEYHNEYFQWMIRHYEELNNIHNMHYWRNMMTEEERGMRKHPNRGHNWIPNRILEIRKKIMETQLNYLFGKDGWTNKEWRIPEDHQCMDCGVKIKATSNYQKGILKLVNREKQRRNLEHPTHEEYAGMLDRAIKRVDKHHDKLTISKSKAILPYWGGYTMTHHKYGFCLSCWENKIKHMLGYTLDDWEV